MDGLGREDEKQDFHFLPGRPHGSLPAAPSLRHFRGELLCSSWWGGMPEGASGHCLTEGSKADRVRGGGEACAPPQPSSLRQAGPFCLACGRSVLQGVPGAVLHALASRLLCPETCSSRGRGKPSISGSPSRGLSPGPSASLTSTTLSAPEKEPAQGKGGTPPPSANKGARRGSRSFPKT